MQNKSDLGLRDAAQFVGVSDTTLRRMIKKKKLNARKKKVSGRIKYVVRRTDLLAAFGQEEDDLSGPGSLTKVRSHAQSETTRHAGGTQVAGDQATVVKILQTELSKREHRIAGLEEELRQARQKNEQLLEKIEALNKELQALLREGWSRQPEKQEEPRGILGFLGSMIRG